MRKLLLLLGFAVAGCNMSVDTGPVSAPPVRSGPVEGMSPA